MDNPILGDKELFPTEEVIFSHIGRAKASWKRFFAYLEEGHPDFNSEWRYYRDGGSWLLKTTRKKKTIFWLTIVKGMFKTTFYFGDKAEPAVMESAISPSLKDSFKNGKRYGKIRGITVEVKKVADLKAVIELIDVKLSIK